jgi:hypothetical protein
MDGDVFALDIDSDRAALSWRQLPREGADVGFCIGYNYSNGNHLFLWQNKHSRVGWRRCSQYGVRVRIHPRLHSILPI